MALTVSVVNTAGWATTTTPQTLVVPSCAVGDYLFVLCGGDLASAVSAATVSTSAGPGTTSAWTESAEILTGTGADWMNLSWCQVTGAGSITVSIARTQSPTQTMFGAYVVRAQGSSGIGNFATSFTASSAETISLTVSGANSAVAFLNLDGATFSPGTGWTPAGATLVERGSSDFTTHAAYWTGQTAGTRSYGSTGAGASSSRRSIAVEILDAGGSAPLSLGARSSNRHVGRTPGRGTRFLTDRTQRLSYDPPVLSGLQIDASTPAFVTAVHNPWTTASFTPPNNSLLVVAVTGDFFGGTPTIGVTSSGLTFVSQIKTGAINEGVVELFTAEVGSNGGTPRTVSATTTIASDPGGIKVWVVTGQHPTGYLDTTGSGSSTTNAITPTVLTTGVDGCWVFGGGEDWNNLGLATSTDVYENGLPGGIAPLAVRKAAATSPAGPVTLNFDASGTGAAMWRWAAISIRPAGGAAAPTGDATLTATAALTAAATADQAATATLTGTATLTATAAVTRPADASLTGTAAITAAAGLALATTAALTGTAGITATATVTRAAAASLTVTATHTATTALQANAAATLTTTATRTAAAVSTQLAAAVQTVTATHTVTAARIANVDATLAATAGITATANVTQSTTASLTATAGITAAATVGAAPILADAALTATAAHTATATSVQGATTALTVTAAHTATATRTQPATGTLTVTSSTTATATVTRPADASLTGTAGITATATVTRVASASLTVTAAPAPAAAKTTSATSSLTVSVAVTADGAVGAVSTLTATAAVTAAVVKLAAASASVTGTATVTATATVTSVAAGALSGSATITATATITRSATASLTGVAVITADAPAAVTARPNTGTTSRPAGGTTTRPAGGTTTRPTGTTPRPFTGTTIRP